jgi:2-phosphoglycerate kinase
VILPKVVIIGGIAGTGKTYLIKQILNKTNDWVRVKPVKLLDSLYSKSLNCYVLGKYSPYYHFEGYADGSDRLSMGVQPSVMEFFSTVRSNVIFEGDRIINNKTLDLLTNGKYDLRFYLLKTTDDIRNKRYKDRNSTQSQKFINSRITKYSNIESKYDVIPRYHNDLEDTLGLSQEIFQVISS